jgi:FixJ family two-component response regulator
MISIVDDDAFVRQALGDLVQSLGYGAVTFPSAEHFLESGRVTETACVITDLQLPGLSGLDLQNHLLAGGHRMPIIIITAYPEENCRRRALSAGAVAFLSKPFSEESLMDCLSTALAGHDRKDLC